MNLKKLHNDIHEGALQLMAEHRVQLFAKAKSLCDNEDEANELVIRTIDQAIRKIDTYSGEGDILSWMMAILENLHNHDWRSPVVRGTTALDGDELEKLVGADWSTDEQILKNSDGEAVRTALRQIDPEFKRLVLMRYYDDFTLREIANVLNMPISTVGRRMQMALRILAGKLEAEFSKAKPKFALLGTFLLAGSLFGAVTWGVVEAVSAVGSLGSEVALESEEPEAALESEGTFGSEVMLGSGSAGDPIDPKDPASDPIAPNDTTVPSPLSATGAGTTGADTLSTTENTEKEDTMNLKSITKSAAQLAVGAALTTGLAANAVTLPKIVVTETTRDAEGRPTAFALSFQNFDAAKSYPLYLVCDAIDSGIFSTNNWAYCERLDDIAPGEVSRVVAAPACLGRDYYAIRFAAECPRDGLTTSANYVQDGLEVMWDAIDNVAVGVHDETADSWADLTGHGFDWKLDLNHAEWTSDGLVLKGTGLVGTSTKGTTDLQRKVKTVEFVYENADKRHGIIFCPALGRTCYLYTDTNGHVGYYEEMGQAVPLDSTYYYSIVYSGFGDAPTGVESCWLNGLEDSDDGMNDFWTMSSALYLGGRNSSPEKPAKGTLRAVRIYSADLTDEQRAQNCFVDAVRFAGVGFFFSECVYDVPRWRYDATAKTITNASTGWRFGVTAVGRELTLVSRNASGAEDPSTVDLAGRVVDADANSYFIAEFSSGLFREDTMLKDVTLPFTLKKIGGNVFRSCTALERVGNFLPPGLLSLGSDAFSYCSKLASPLVMGDLCVAAIRDDGLAPGNYWFNECSKLPSAVLGKSFTTLEKWAFYRCVSLTNLVFRGAVTKIDQNAVRECTALRHVEPFLPDSLTYLGSDAFSGCTALESPLSLALENRVTLDGNYHFYNCPSIPSVALGKTWEIPEYCFYNCTGVRTFFLPEEPIVQLPGSQRRWAFTGWTEYQSRWIMPKDSKVWMNLATNSTVVTALTKEERALYRSSFNDKYECVGVFADCCAKQWLCKLRKSGTMVFVR